MARRVQVQVPEIRCMEPENYRKYFRALCWSAIGKNEKKSLKKLGKKEKLRRIRVPNEVAACYAPAFLGNPSQFAVYATVRKSVLARWRHLQGTASEVSDDSDSEETASQPPLTTLPKITSIGLQTVFALISQARLRDADFCENALKALLDVLQGHAPEELAQEPSDIICKLHSMLVEIAGGCGPSGQVDAPTALTALGSSCLIALSVARGDAELILSAVASLLMSTSTLFEQYIQIPANLTSLQRSVQSVILGASVRNQWLSFGVQQQSLVTSFPVELPTLLTVGSAELVVRSLVSDGSFLYVFTSKGLLKIGSGYGSSIKQHVYLYKPDFFPGDRHGWLGYCKNKLYLRIGRKKTEVYEIDKETLEVTNIIRLDPGQAAPVEPKSAIFTDGNQLGLMQLTSFDNLTIRMFDVDLPPARPEGTTTTTLTSESELKVCILMGKTFILGRSPFEDGFWRRTLELEAPVAVQLEESDDDPIRCISGGQDFVLVATGSGKVYYTGKGTSLGYKEASPNTGKWTLMKEPLFSRNEAINVKKNKVIQVAVGHEGVHAILVLDNGTALFTGIARRGEDGDVNKHRRAPKPTRPKKIFKANGHNVVFAACNYGSTALVTRQGLLLMFGKDTQHCDSAGVMLGLRHERVIEVALGKAHGVVLTALGHVYTFGINNKGQCGRDFGYTKEKACSSHRQSSSGKEESRLCTTAHAWAIDYCRVCVLCRECTGFSSACHCAQLPNRVPGEKCGCGEGDSGCSVCGVCRNCVGALSAAAGAGADRAVADMDDDTDPSVGKSEKVNPRHTTYEPVTSSETERDAGMKVSCLPPARVAVPGGHRVVGIACGLHHTVLLTDHGDVLTFGSNQYGQLGAGDTSAHHRIVRVRLPRASVIAAGSNHTAVLTRDEELYTFGSYQKGSLGRPRPAEDPQRTDRCPVWYATPGRVPHLESRYACKVVWAGASGDQTYMHVSQSLIKTDTFFSSTITANSNSIIILPNLPEHTLKCVTINRSDGTSNSWMGPEQVDFVNTLACLDPLYDVLWCYQPQMKIMKCYNIQAFDVHKLQKCCNNGPESYQGNDESTYPNYGNMKRLEDFKNLENLEMACNNEERPAESVALSDMSVLNEQLAIPSAAGCRVTRIHAALHLLACLDCLTHPDTKHAVVQCARDNASPPVAVVKEDFQTVNRFESHGGGWGYSGLSVEAIRFMCDTDILLGGFGLFGGRGDYTAKIRVYDIGPEGGDQEGDGELLAESDEVVYECAPRDRYPVHFPVLVPLIANRWYVAWACINGPSSDCGSSGQAMVINDEIGFHFKTSKKSNNGTDVNAGQIPVLLYNTFNPDDTVPLGTVEAGDPVIALSKNFCRKVTVPCFRSLITLLHKSWSTFKDIVLKTNGLVPIDYQKLSIMKHQKRLVYVIRACLRLVKSYINEIYPQNSRKSNSNEYMPFLEAIADARNLIQAIMADATPTCGMLSRKARKNRSHRVCYVQFAMETTNAILKEAHETITACFHAFFPTPTLKWNHLCSLLFHVKDGVVPSSQNRELASSCAAMCASRSLRDVLNYVVPVTQSRIMTSDHRRPESRVIKEVPSKSATVPRSSHAQKPPPPVPPRSNHREIPKPPDAMDVKTNYTEWHLFDAIPRLLDIVLIPIKEQMMTRQCGQPHDHGEIKQRERLAEFCCKLIARIIAELSYSAINTRDDPDTDSAQHLVTPSRFMRVNQSRAWNTGNGSPDSICFTVDRPGVMLVGICVYGGLGDYEYSVELLHDSQQMCSTDEESKPVHYWVCEETAHGAFSAADCRNDIVQLKFARPIPIREDLRYVVRLFNHGGRTVNGDCGLQSVKGPDGTTFRFASCSLSVNGTTLARGQIPSLIYYGTSKLVTNWSESTDSLMKALRGITLRAASMVIERGAELFCTLRNELTLEDLRRNAAVLQQSPAVNVLLPYTLANLEGLCDSKSVIKMLEMIHQLLPHVAAMNLLVPTVEEVAAATTTTQYYTWVESEHPYKQATVTNMRVLFPNNVAWMVLEMDPRSITAQPEDTLTVYAVAGALKKHCHCSDDVADSPFRKRVVQLKLNSVIEDLDIEEDDVVPCLYYRCTYVSVTPKMANNATDWPQKALLIPGNEAIFSFETASDYLTEFNRTNNDENRFGFRCLCIGYEDSPLTSQRQSLAALEMELVYAGASCASRLLAPDLDIPPLNFSTLMEVQMHAMIGGSPPGAEAESAKDGSEAMLLSKGLELSSPPNIHHMLDGQPLLRCESTERQFLSDFVAGAESTAGGRLARWLAPTSRVDPALCEIKAPAQPPRPSIRTTVPVLLRDQYGELVSSPEIKFRLTVHKLEESDSHQRRASIAEGYYANVPDVPYQATLCDTTCLHAITMMKVYQNFSFEEIRLASMLRGDVGACASVGALSYNAYESAVQLLLRAQHDGSFVAAWTPRGAGTFVLRCTLDNHPIPQELTIEVAETSAEGTLDGGAQIAESGEILPRSPPTKLRRFAAQCSAGLRVRASPSLQAEELGRVPPGANIAFVEEVVNKDGTWVRLSAESVRTYAEGSAEVAWCLQHHRHVDRALLVPVDSTNTNTNTPHDEFVPAWSGSGNAGDAHGNMHSWDNDDEIEVDLDEITCLADRRLLALQSDQADESDSGSNPFLFSVEPSKRGRMIRNESLASSVPAPSGVQRSNGNSDEWGSLVKQRPSDNIKDVNTIRETDIEPAPNPGPELRSSSSHAQTGTQTSPMVEDSMSAIQMYMGGPKEGRLSPKSMARERIASRARAYKRVASPPPPLPARAAPPPLPARAAPAPPTPLKTALSPAQVECMRAIFAAVVWHEGIVHDAIACATYLKFHPELSKQGALVMTAAPEVRPPRHQRHSVEVVNAGQYLRIDPSTLETLKRSGVEASSSRIRKTDIDMAIREEEAPGHSSDTGPASSVVNELPSVLQVFVAIWDSLYDSDQLTAATNKLKKDITEKNKNDDSRPLSILRKKRDWRSSPYSVRCELCGNTVPPPFVAAHMRRAHPGCRAYSNKGYDFSGVYRRAAAPTGQTDIPMFSGSCGQTTQGLNQLWYMFCEKCRVKALKGLPPVKQRRTQAIPEVGNERPEPAAPPVDHHVIRENALFLLDLAPLLDSDLLSPLAWPDSTSRNPLTPPGSVWQPAPPFQCLPALGAAPRVCAQDAARYHSLGRPTQPTTAPPPPLTSVCSTVETRPKVVGSRVQRSLSMGQEGDRDFAGVASADPQEAPADVGSSVHSQPSRAVQWLVGSGEWAAAGSTPDVALPRLDTNALMSSPVLSFVLSTRNLNSLRQKMDAAVRINTVRQYAFEALNWLLRSATLPMGVHDVMWWFCNALDKYARIVPPPLALCDNKQNAPNDANRTATPTASTSVICPGGSRSARAARAAFHSFLGSVSAIAPSLPPASAAALQAVRCWALHYSPQDRAFLHRSQVFSVISKILSHSEDGAHEEALLESYHTHLNKENFVWSCPDVTGLCDISVSSRQGMAGALTDASTETFWESGDEDRNKNKWIQVDYPGGTPQDHPYIMCVHIDNTRDTMNKILLVSFLYSSGSNEMTHMHDIEVDPKTATWLNYTLPRSKSGESVRIRCELRGPEPAVRVRQVRLLGAPTLLPSAAASPTRALHALSEADTLRVFRLLTSQVFGKLLEWDRSGSESGGEGAAAVAEDGAAGDSNLREHVVGILFAGHKLTSLQKLVMSHIVCAIGAEATRVRDDWETALLWQEAAERAAPDQPHRHLPHLQDNYCFEMLSLLLALSGSAVGCAHLSQRTELVADLLALLHTGSERVQRQVVLLLKRMIAEIPPQKMLAALNHDTDQATRVSLLDHLVCYLGKAITLQMKVKGAGGAAAAGGVTLGGSVSPAPAAAWFMRGDTLKKHAHLVAKLLSDMAEDKLSSAWGKETRAALAGYVSQVAQMADADRRPARCIATPTVWMALAALCVCEQSHVELINGEGRARGDEDSRPLCANHDDGTTGAVVECRECGPLCAECDRFLHLNRASRMHRRQICKEEEGSVRIDIHEGCGRAKLFWLLLLVDRRTLKALAEFRGMESGACDGSGAGPSAAVASGQPGLAGTCRFCGSRGTSGLLAIGNVCADQQCQEHGKEACNSVLACGHLCGGVQGERRCLPCLYGCAAASDGDAATMPAPLRQDADDMCMICFTDPLQAAPALQLKCGHVFHLHCCKKVLANKWIGPRITFSFSQCPICKEDMDHWTLKDALAPIRNLREEVKQKALMRLEYEGVVPAGAGAGAGGKEAPDPAVYAMERYAYYVCHKCGKAYFGGLARCEAETSGWWEPAELVCGACSDVAGAGSCPKHGADFLEYKCRYCCSVAVFFCFGTSHFCNACHDDFQRVTNIPKHLLPQCPAGPKGEQLPGKAEECPLHVKHPATGEEFALGCGVCRHSHAF